MTWFISICTDMKALRETGLVSEDSPYRGPIDGKSGAHVYYNGNMSAIVLTDIQGLEPLQDLPMVTVTTPEAVFGYRRQVTMEEVPRDEAMHTLYKQVYDYTQLDEEGNPLPKFFAVPGGESTEHLL